MSSAKKMMKAFYLPMFGLDGNKNELKNQWKEFKSNVDKVWDQYQEMQKAAKEAWKEQWNTFFVQCIEMEKTVAETLPDQKAAPLPGMPAAPLSPKEVAGKVVEFQEMANQHAVEQTDSLFDFHMKGQQQVKEIVTDVVKNVESSVDNGQAAEEKK